MILKRSLIIEGDHNDVAELELFVSRLSFFTVPDIGHSAEDALAFISQSNYDVIFLNLELPGVSGLELLKSLTRPLRVIVTSTQPSYALECYDLNVVDFLIKPISFQRFLRAVNRAVQPYQQRQDRIFLRIGRKVQLFKYKDVTYMEAEGAYTKIWQKGRFVLVSDPISSIYERLPKDEFVRVHKSFIVNISELTSYDYRTIWLGEVKIPIGDSYRKPFQAYLGGDL